MCRGKRKQAGEKNIMKRKKEGIEKMKITRERKRLNKIVDDVE